MFQIELRPLNKHYYRYLKFILYEFARNTRERGGRERFRAGTYVKVGIGLESDRVLKK